MPKFKFEDQGDGEHLATLTDRDGDVLSVTTYHDKQDNSFTAVINVNGEVVGVKRKQAVALALALLDAVEDREE